ncbi:acyl-CoA dehydrogenase family protein [Acrocarpospora catenulata]|uniref:acyl-CoA dehydrogenase family protein n=1 Tax=Acrocarpospora catenulata TaxID=2836182 RepID=UPI001BDA5448|nr:acyl-CoA dehydrogenase family protein [Acrocarpospora catenulata]
MSVNVEIVEAVRRYARTEVAPVATRLEREGAHPWVFGPALAEMGLFGAGIDEKYGGLSLNESTRVRIVEELAYAWASLAGTVTTIWVAGGLIQTFGTEEQKEHWLPKLAAGEVIASISLSEPQAGSDTSALLCRAELDGDDYVIDGAKTWVTNGSRANLIVLAARTGDRLSAFLVERDPAAPGPTLSVSQPFDKLGHRASDTVEMTYSGHRIPAAGLLGGPDMLGRGQHAFLNRIDVGRMHVGAIALGLARAALDQSISYAAQREAFGKPIDQHQAIAFKLADMAVRVRSAELMLDHAAARYDAGEDIQLACSMAKLVCSEAGLFVTEEALRIHGGIGYVSDLPIERYFRDVRLEAIGEGTNEIQHVVISRWLKKHAGLPR